MIVYKLFVPLIMTFLSACSMQKNTSLKQGAQGYIYLKTGNQMPTIGKPVGKDKGLSREIFFYQPTTSAEAIGAMPMFDAIKSKLILTVKSDADGRYQAKLPEGSYSVFVKEDGKFFGAITDGNGVINPIKVNLNTITQYNLTITAKAAF